MASSTSIQDMIDLSLLKVGDTIEFTFKGNVFSAQILRGGLIGKCQQRSVHDTEPTPVLETTIGFSSLTAWTESCLQDLLEEYYTRYSSWKRVFHRESKRSMSDIRDQCKLYDKKRKHEDVSELYREIYRLQRIIDEMNLYIKTMHTGASKPNKQWTYLAIQPKTKQMPFIKKIKRKYTSTIAKQAQDIICKDIHWTGVQS